MSAHEECSRCNLVSGHDAATKSAAADGAVATAVADAATAAADPHRTASPRLKRRQCACCGPVSTANLALRAHCAAGVPGGCDTTVMVGCQGCGGTAGNVFRSAICMAKFAADLLDTRSRHNTYSTECLSVFGLVDWKAVAKGNVLVADVADKYSTVFIVNARGELMWRYTCPWCYGRCVELPRPTPSMPAGYAAAAAAEVHETIEIDLGLVKQIDYKTWSLTEKPVRLRFRTWAGVEGREVEEEDGVQDEMEDVADEAARREALGLPPHEIPGPYRGG